MEKFLLLKFGKLPEAFIVCPYYIIGEILFIKVLDAANHSLALQH